MEFLEFLHHGPFVFAKSPFTLLGEKRGNGPTGSRLDEFVGVSESEVQLRGHELPHGGLAGSHEADEGQIVDHASAGHNIELAQIAAGRT